MAADITFCPILGLNHHKMSLMSKYIFWGQGIRFQQYFNNKIIFLVIYLHIHMNLFLVTSICICKVSISKIINVGTSVITIFFRVILTEIL